MSTQTLEQQKVEQKVEEIKKLVLFNDDVNTFDHVINLLVKVCKHETIQAEQCATLVHYKGKCAVKSGSFDELKIMSEILADNGLTVEIN
ncbi:MAG: ATP-dependent Clp protease adaptor ClpS [Flavobacteriales bacterium]|nr:ATP-dependent Clp protease adaptor ClpS [Flavobacteriales bacterium]MCB9336065.1 ATP-dependent Clp protease adaptor ClpS [Flavobacteriales bacterium]